MTTAPLPLQLDADGLIPAVIQDAVTGDVLMVGFMNDEALAATRGTGRVHFWSRSRMKLWRKGETSGHEQLVREIAVNCDLNSVLIKVQQIGAVCHDGYPTCYYRRLDPDNSLTVTHERAFDPGDVYANRSKPPLADLTRELMSTYALLRDHDLTAVSATSRRLRAREDTVTERVADELNELAGVLDGTHRHRGMQQDVALEASQVIYWITVASLRTDLTWSQLRPDVALSITDDVPHAPTIATLIRADAATWRRQHTARDVAASTHASLALVAQSCMSAGIDTADLIASDLQALRAKPYLATLIAQGGTSAGRI